MALLISVSAVATPLATADPIPGGWPATCVALNDLVEASLGNSENVGIYQRVYGEQAEDACQNDHRADVQASFAWVLGSTSDPISVESSPGAWPETCIALNDLVEAALGHPENVGIYQRAYGDQAELACQTDHRSDVLATFYWALPRPTPEPEPSPVAPVVAPVLEQPDHECANDDVDAPAVRLVSPLVSSFTLEATIQQHQNQSVVDIVMRLPQFAEFSNLVGTELAGAVPMEYAPQNPWPQSRFDRLALTAYIGSVEPFWSSVLYRWYNAQNRLLTGGGSVVHPMYGRRILDPRHPYRLRLSYNHGNVTLHFNQDWQFSLRREADEWLVRNPSEYGQPIPYHYRLPHPSYPWVVVEIGCRGLVTLSDIRIDGVVVNEDDVRDLLSEPQSRPRRVPSPLTIWGRQPDFHCRDEIGSFITSPVLSSFTLEMNVHNKQHRSLASIRLEIPDAVALSDLVGVDIARQIPSLYGSRRFGIRSDSLVFGRQGNRTFEWFVIQEYTRLNSSETGTILLDPGRPYTLRLEYQNGHIVLYINGQLKHTEMGLPYPWMTLSLDCSGGAVSFSNIRIDGVGVDEQLVRDFLNQLAVTGGG